VKEHIQAGDVFQLVLSQRFRRRTFADPFEIYRCGPAAFAQCPCKAPAVRLAFCIFALKLQWVANV